MGSFKEQMGSDLSDVFFVNGVDTNGNDKSEFAETFLYRPAGVQANQYAISGIVDATTEVPIPQSTSMNAQGNYAKALTKYIRVMIKEVDILSAISKSDTVVVKNQEYSIPEFSSDGVGVLTLVLHRK